MKRGSKLPRAALQRLGERQDGVGVVFEVGLVGLAVQGSHFTHYAFLSTGRDNKRIAAKKTSQINKLEQKLFAGVGDACC